MKTNLDMLVLIPVGPKYHWDYVKDTIDSIRYFVDAAVYKILLVNDTGDTNFHQNLTYDAQLIIHDVTTAERIDQCRTTFGQLFAKQVVALIKLSQNYEWKCLLRLDDDALLIGANPQSDALEKFEKNPCIGMLGAYRVRGDGSNKEKAMAQKGRLLIRQILSMRGRRGLARSIYLAFSTFTAMQFGYRLGDMCTGGAFFMSGEACRDMIATLDANIDLFCDCRLDDDLLFALHVAAGGRILEDFSKPDQIMAINWRGLPMPLEELVARCKKIVHPVREPDNATHELKVRQFFSSLRTQLSPHRGEAGFVKTVAHKLVASDI